MRLEINTRRLVGMPEQDAIRAIEVAGAAWNIVKKNGIPVNTATDFRLDRINLEIMAGKVTKAYVG